MLRACGITEFYVRVEQVATARLKEHPEDFIVVEVDTEGVRTDDAKYTFPAPLATHSISQSTYTTTTTTNRDNNDADNNGAVGANSRLLSAAVRDALHAAFGGKADAIARYNPATEGQDPSVGTKELVIGAFSLKEERRELHRAVKTAFPHLRTQTRRIPSIHGGDDVCDHQVVATPDGDYLLLAYLLGERVADAVEAWGSAASPSGSFRVMAVFPVEATKAVRRAFHEMMARRYPGILCRVANGHVTLKVSPSGPRGKRVPETTPPGVFTHLLVRKRNIDMMELRVMLAEHFGVPETSVCVAGLKDKCAITYQRCSVPGFCGGSDEKQHLGGVCRLAWPGNTSSYVEILQTSGPYAVPVEIGQLNGNWFNIHLRRVRGMTRDAFSRRANSVESRGFLNYFGQQRFSEHLTNVSDHVGVHLLAGRWADAVRVLVIAAPGLYESFPERMEARHVPGNLRDAQCIVQALHHLHRTQYASLSPPLSRDDVTGCTHRWQQLCHSALLAVPFAIRVLWVHAAQSLIFNLVLSELHRLDALSTVVQTLPLLGYQVTVEDFLQPILEKMLAELDLSLDAARKQRKVLGVPLPGGMRSAIVRPVGYSLAFDDKEEEESEQCSEEDGFGVRLSFALPPSSYATVFLREVLGCDEAW